MRRSILCLLLMAALLIGLCSVTALATEEATEATTSETAVHTDHCVCGGAAEDLHGCEDIIWQPLPEGTTDFGTLATGNYYLTDDVSITSVSNIKNKHITICLNGNSATRTDGRLFGYIGAGDTVVSICDCSGTQDAEGNWHFDGLMSGTNESNKLGGIMYQLAGNTVNIYGGNFTGTGTYKYGSVFYMSTESQAAGYPTYSTLNIYNGNLTYGAPDPVSSNGGLIAAYNACEINIYGGTISGGRSVGSGGCIYSKGHITISGGTISGGQTDYSGGNIYSLGSLTVTGGTIKGGTSVNSGGNIYVSNTSGSLTISGGTISGGTVGNETTSGDGGNICSTAPITMSGGTVENGTATKNGGNIYVTSTMDLSGGTVSGGKATKGGGNIMVTTGASLMVTGGQLTGGTAMWGGSIYTYQGSVYVGSGIVTGGTATGSSSSSNGGNIAIEGGDSGNAVLTISGDATISGGNAVLYGGNIATVNNKTTLEITGGTISDGTVTKHGGNIYAYNPIISNATLTGGKSTNDSGGNLYLLGTAQLNSVNIEGGEGWNGGGIYVPGGSSLTMENGYLMANTARSKGGSLYLANGASASIHYCNLIEGTARAEGGNIWATTLELGNGNTIVCGSAGTNGGNIYATELSISDSSIYAGIATENGGNIYAARVNISGGNLSGDVKEDESNAVDGGNLYITESLYASGGTSISGGRVTNCGGNIYLSENAYANIEGITIDYGYSSGNSGGNIYSKGELFLNNAIVSNGEGWNGGNIWCSGPLELNNSELTYGTARNNGGNLYATSALTLSDFRMNNGFAKNNGGNAYFDASQTSIIYSGKFENGYAGNFGGSVWARYLELNDSFLTGGEADKVGGNLCIANQLTITNTTVASGTAGTNGGNGWISNLTSNNSSYTSGSAKSRGGNLFIEKSATINGGYIRDGYSEGNGGNICAQYGTTAVSSTDMITLSGVLLENGKSYSNGGNIWARYLTVEYSSITSGTANGLDENNVGHAGGNICAATSLVMTESFVTDGYAAGNGGNVWAESITLSGGSITGGKSDGRASDLYLPTSKGTISGMTTIDSLFIYKPGAGLDVSGLDDTSVIPLLCHNAGQFATATTDKTHCFTSVDDYTVAYNSETGALYIPVQVQLVNGTSIRDFGSIQDAIDATSKGYLVLCADVTENMEVTKDLYLDLNGYDITGTVTVAEGKTLYGMDSTTDDYDCSDGYGTIASVSGTVATHHKSSVTGSVMRYLTVTEDTGVSFHRIYLGITKLTLRPTSNGFGYKALFCADEKAQAMLSQSDAFGYQLWLDGSANVAKSSKDLSAFASGQEVSLLLKNFDIANFGETPVNAAVYLKLTDGTIIESTTYSYSMQDMMEMLNTRFDDLGDAQKQAVKSFWSANEASMAAWAIEDIRAYDPTAMEEPTV